MKKFYITTPIYYINDRPHVGHAYTTIAADALARFYKSRGRDAVLLVGTDENSQKTVDAAEKSGESLEPYTDRMANIWKTTWEKLGIDFNDFIRTTEERHKKMVEVIWKRIWDKGDIYKGKYEGLYCNGHEAFLKESDLVDGICPDHKTRPDRIVEENYFFRLSKYQKELLEFYDANPRFVTPEGRFNEVKSFVRQGLEDVSASRATQKWGIPVPNDPAHVVYVWFDALINYISAIGLAEWESHPADAHLIGKDIVRFHAVIWPAMLLSAGLPLPRQVVTNGFFTVDGVKISKSLGNAVDPLSLASKYGNDALRYFLLREIPYGEDGDFSIKKFKERYTADLANGLGNFAARVLALAGRDTNILMPANDTNNTNIEKSVANKIQVTKKNVSEKIEVFRLHEALVAIWELIDFGDEYVNEKKPWKSNDVDAISNLVVILDNIAALLAPFLPETAEKITKSIVWEGDKLRVKKIEPLFPRILFVETGNFNLKGQDVELKVRRKIE